MSHEEDPHRGVEDRVDEIARGAGAALRQPAPADGIARVRSSRRRRQTARIVTAGSAAVLAVVGVFIAFDRDSDHRDVVTQSVPTTVPDVTTPQVVAPPSSTTTTTAPTTTTSAPTTTTPPTTTTATPTTTAPTAAGAGAGAGVGWRPSDEPLPPLAYDACCGLNWTGDPSPAVPVDAAAPLAAGIYNVRSAVTAASARDFDDGVLTLEVRPYTRCLDVAEPSCTDAPFDPDELGIANDPARTIDLVLDDSLLVGVHGFACQDDQLQLDVELGTGDDLVALATELDASYDTVIGVPLQSGVDPAQVVADLTASPSAGFADAGCMSYTNFAWTPSSGPGILTFLDLGAPEDVPLPSAAARFIRPTAISVDEDGVTTLYLFAGFQS